MAIADVAAFNRSIVDATKDLVCAYKPNLAFYEALGLRGLSALEETISYIRAEAPRVVVVGDAKRGDVGTTNARYARALFEVWGFDAATVNAWAGGESLEPFLEYEDRCVFVWCRSSNPGARDLQDLVVSSDGEATPLYRLVATRAAEWNRRGNVGVVVGATYPRELGDVRTLCPDMPILVPGVGAQSGNLRASVKAGMDRWGRNLIVSSSRGVLYASREPGGFAQAARRVAEDLRSRVNRTLEEGGKGW
jgi:orotidine-5'-phosphate decarboxylase